MIWKNIFVTKNQIREQKTQIAPSAFGRQLQTKNYLLGDGLSQGQEGHGDDEVEGPVDGRGQRVAETSCPHGIDLGVDGPRHRTHARSEEEQVGTEAQDDQPLGLTLYPTFLLEPTYAIVDYGQILMNGLMVKCLISLYPIHMKQYFLNPHSHPSGYQGVANAQGASLQPT